MDFKPVIAKAQEFAYAQSKEYQLPSLFHVDYANEVGQRLATQLHANAEIVLLGTLFMDCMLGPARKEGKQSEHALMSAQEAKKFLTQFHNFSEKDKENVYYCALQHHGGTSFYSLEAEICCNVDCYRFASVKGAIGGMINGHSINLDELIALYRQKADEKWNALTLEICKKELKPQYQAIKEFLNQYHG